VRTGSARAATLLAELGVMPQKPGDA
jgi:hypothetical protein